MNKVWLTVCITALLLLVGCEAPATPEPAPEVDAEITAPEPAEEPMLETEAPSKEETEPAEEPAQEEKTEEPKEEVQIAPELTVPNTEIIAKKTILGSSSEDKKKFSDTTWISDIVCGTLFADGTSHITFTFENKDKEAQHLGHVTAEESHLKKGMSLRVNGKRIRSNAQEVCGTDIVEPYKKVTCTLRTKLRKGKTYWGKELNNKIEADGLNFYTEARFRCV